MNNDSQNVNVKIPSVKLMKSGGKADINPFYGANYTYIYFSPNKNILLSLSNFGL